MSLARILEEAGFVPAVPAAPALAGTAQALVHQRVPVVPVVPAGNNESLAGECFSEEDGRERKADARGIRARLLASVTRTGQDPAIMEGLDRADLGACRDLDDRQLTIYLTMLADTATRYAGRRPPMDNTPIHCDHCGPAWVHPDLAASLPLMNGWPHALACPWCPVREAGRYMPRPAITCGACRYGVPDTINPATGMNGCAAGYGMHYPMASHRCARFQPSP